MRSPRLSIVMPCLNRVNFIAEALDSIFNQNLEGIEVIIADGGSTDGTLDVLKNYPQVKVFVGPDTGLYQALNKAISNSSGEIIGHLNTDDIYLPGTFKAVLDAFNSNDDVDMVCGSAELVSEIEGGKWQIKEHFDALTHAKLTWPLVLKGAILTNARFYRRGFLMQCGPFDETYKLIADREFLIKALELRPRTIPVESTVLHYRQHADSLTFNEDLNAMKKGFLEKVRLAKQKYEAAEAVSIEAKRYAEWGQYEASLGFINSLKQFSLPSLFYFYSEGQKFGPGWFKYLTSSLLHKGFDKIHNLVRNKK